MVWMDCFAGLLGCNSNEVFFNDLQGVVNEFLAKDGG